MASDQSPRAERDITLSNDDAYRAVADWHRAFFTGIVLSTVARRGPARAAELVEAIFSHQRMERFLPGLKKLGIDHLPAAVAAAQYHYLSNDIGGVPVEYMYESDRKAWIRYPVPRWAWTGTALCGIPTEVSRAMLAGWHAQNGVSLGNPRLGFVCTKQAVDGDSGLEGYYFEHDHDLAPNQRLRFARGEDAPDFDPHAAPVLPTSSWPAQRLAKAHRNYAMQYIRTALPVAVNLWGEHEAGSLMGLTAKLIGMQFHRETQARLGLNIDPSPAAFAEFAARLIKAQGDQCEVHIGDDCVQMHQSGWSLMDDLESAHPVVARAFNGLLEGALSSHNHRLVLDTQIQRMNGRFEFDWSVRTKAR
jgi:hypothetical protein